VREREEIFDRVPELRQPDFAQEERLPPIARFDDEPGLKDDWEKHLKDSLSHMSREEWESAWKDIQELFTGGITTEVNRQLSLAKDDLSCSGHRSQRNIAKGQAIIDIDSILAMFTDLSMIQSAISFCITSNPARNLSHTVHLQHKSKPLHHIPHFYLGQFGHDPKFDLYIMLPALYDKDKKRSKRNLYNHVPEVVISQFMNSCFLPSVKKVIGSNEGQSWDFHYEVSKANSMASSKEGKIHSQRKGGFRQEILKTLDGRHVEKVWKCCEVALRREMRSGRLREFKDFQFFINAKGYKHRMRTDNMPALMTIYKEEVPLIYISLIVD
jgi:hypothetical protein